MDIWITCDSLPISLKNATNKNNGEVYFTAEEEPVPAIMWLDETDQLDPEVDYPFRQSLTKCARCGMCEHENKSYPGYTPNGCGFGNEQHSRPTMIEVIPCGDYSFKHDSIRLPPEGKIYGFSGYNGPYIPKLEHCDECANLTFFHCTGVRYYPYKIEDGKCEFFYPARLICLHAIPMLQLYDHHPNFYCCIPPEDRHKEEHDGGLSTNWECHCPWANTIGVRDWECYESRAPTAEDIEKEETRKAYNTLQRSFEPVGDIFVHVGDGIYVTHRGMSDGIKIDMGQGVGRCNGLYIDEFAANSILADLGTDTKSGGWSSWQREHYFIDPSKQYITFYDSSRRPNRHLEPSAKRVYTTKRIKDVIMSLVCPYLSSTNEGKIRFKWCESCLFGKMPRHKGECTYKTRDMYPIVTISQAGEWWKYIYSWAYHDMQMVEGRMKFRLVVRDPEWKGDPGNLWKGMITNLHKQLAEIHPEIKHRWNVLHNEGEKGPIGFERNGQYYQFDFHGDSPCFLHCFKCGYTTNDDKIPANPGSCLPDADDQKLRFVEYWGLHNNPSNDVRFKVTLNMATFEGEIYCDEHQECDSYDDWMQLKGQRWEKQQLVIEAFAKLLWAADGALEPIPLPEREQQLMLKWK